MNTNNVLTYLLYALLAGLICVAGYKACKMKEKQARVAQEDAEFQQTLRDFGYLEEDTTSSAYTEDGTTYTESPTTTGTSNDGIEDDYTPSGNSNTLTQPEPKPTRNTNTSSTPSSPDPVPSSNLSTKYSNNDGRYRVIAGSFTVLDGARREMERLIKMGYHDAEVGKYNRGRYAVVIVKRTNSLSEANSIKAALQQKGIDAAVIDRDRR